MRRAIGCLLLALTFSLLAAGPGQARIAVHELGPQPERGPDLGPLDDAEPLPILHLHQPEAAPPAVGGPVPTASGPELSVPGREPRVATGSVSFQEMRGRFLTRGVRYPRHYPNRAWGKVWAEIPGVGRHTCSGTVVRSRNRNVVFTAGHCVYDPEVGRWASWIRFVPAFNRGRRPLGSWRGKAALAPRPWVRSGNANYDYAAVTMARKRSRRLENVTGSLGLVWNPRRRRTYRAAGYPSNKRSGDGMWQCLSRFRGSDWTGSRQRGPRPIRIGCDMKAGASGGGWMTVDRRLISVTAYGRKDEPRRLYGPAFDRLANEIRRRAGQG